MQLNEGDLAARWLRLGRYDRDAWRIAHEANDENVWEVYSARLRRVEAVRLKILGRYTRLKRPEQPGILNKTVTWCPDGRDLETYDAATIVLTGKVSHYIKLRADDFELIEARWVELDYGATI